MQRISFQSEQPASEDVFPGGSHEKVAGAMGAYILSTDASKVIGLDGEFGSGKSSILSMLQTKLIKANPRYSVWFFDCEENYQGSIKSNFIELFTQRVLQDVPEKSPESKKLKYSRDLALGRIFKYKKRTTSRVSAWTLALLTSLFFSTGSFKEIFALGRVEGELNWLLMSAHILAFISPGIILFAAWVRNRNEMDGEENWSLLSLFKGSSDDTIDEKIEVAKEVTPLDLKRTLTTQLKVVSDQHYVVIIDNLDRLPKDSLRAVWSDLEIFTSVAEAQNLTVIVPFCSTKIARYLGSEDVAGYDAKDFIAKKFPIVFRSPPVMASGWKNGFLTLWQHTFGAQELSTAEHCGQLLHRHSPMANKLVTPRLQKKFINDIATTSLVVGDSTSLLAIAAHLLLCKYNEYPLHEIMRTDGFSEAFANQKGGDIGAQGKETNTLLTSVLGNSIETGWQIQFLQIHFLTSSQYAIAELLDTPLEEAFASHDGEKLHRLTALFGFADAFKRFVATGAPAATMSSILPVVQAAHEKHGGDWPREMMTILNVTNPPLSEKGYGDSFLYGAIGYCLDHGLNKTLFAAHGEELKAEFLDGMDAAYDEAAFQTIRNSLLRFDHYLDSLGMSFDAVVLQNAENLMHLLPAMSDLKIVRPALFSLADEGLKNAHRQLASCPSYPLSMTPLEASTVATALIWLYGNRKLNSGIAQGIELVEASALSKFCGAAGEQEGAVIGLALAESIDSPIMSAVLLLTKNSNSSTVRAVAAVTYIRQQDAKSLSELEDLETTIQTPLFRALGNAALDAGMLFSLLTSEAGAAVANYLAYLISEKKVYWLSYGWVMTNYGVLADEIEEYGVDAHKLLMWFNDWDRHLDGAGKDIAGVDPRLIAQVFESEADLLSTFKAAACAYVISPERTQSDWLQIIKDSKRGYRIVMGALARAGSDIDCAPVIKDSVTHFLAEAIHAVEGFELTSARLESVTACLSLLDAGLKSLIGVELRTLIYSQGAALESLATVLSNFGQLIPDVQPSSTHEVGKLISILDYISREPSSTGDVAAFFDAKAEQIAGYKYSPELRKAMGGVIAKLAERAPALFKQFAETRGFIGMLKGLTSRKFESDA